MAKISIKGGYIFICSKCGRAIVAPTKNLTVKECLYCKKSK